MFIVGNPAYPSYQVLLAAGVAAVITAVVMPFFIKLMRHEGLGQQVRADGPKRHLVKQGTPTMGGVIFIAAMSLAVLTFLPRMIAQRDFRPLVMLGLSLIFAAVGFVDDWTKIRKKRNQGITPKQKLLLQMAAAVLFLVVMRVMGYLSSGLYLPVVGTTVRLPWIVYLILSVFIIVGADNAVNLTDGIDGLCTSVTLVVSVFFSIVFLRESSGASIFSLALAGGLLGFFLFNKHPARVFMGDTGSLFLGGAVCAMAFAYDMPLIIIPVWIVYIMETL